MCGSVLCGASRAELRHCSTVEGLWMHHLCLCSRLSVPPPLSFSLYRLLFLLSSWGPVVFYAKRCFAGLTVPCRLTGWPGCRGDYDSCSVYGTGRIHCHSKISVNYHRAINRAEKEPLDDARAQRLIVSLLLCLWVGWVWCHDSGVDAWAELPVWMCLYNRCLHFDAPATALLCPFWH